MKDSNRDDVTIFVRAIRKGFSGAGYYGQKKVSVSVRVMTKCRCRVKGKVLELGNSRIGVRVGIG